MFRLTVALLGPIPNPRKKREMSRCHQVLVKADQMTVMNEMKAVRKMVPRRPRRAFIGSVIQHPIVAQQNCRELSVPEAKDAWNRRT
jgi:hypothetical protein